jgi:alkaline phosphatase D
MAFRFAFASCAGGWVLSSTSNHPIFSTIEARRPHFMLHMGDLHYRNIGRDDITAFRNAYDAVLTRSRQASLFRRTPVVYMWDDHDYGPNDSDRTSRSRPSARLAYTEHVPHYPLALQNGAVGSIQQEFTVGRVRFIVSDLRSERDPLSQADGAGKSMLGAPQRDWLVAAFTRAASDQVPLVFWVGSVPWITREGDPEHGWQPYSWERQWLADRLASLGLARRLVMLSGDAHMVAIDDGRNSNYATGAKGERGFPVVHAAPLDRGPRIKGGPYSGGVSERNHQFGWADVEDDGTTVRATLTAHDERGRQIPGMQLRLVCRGGVCEIVT